MDDKTCFLCNFILYPKLHFIVPSVVFQTFFLCFAFVNITNEHSIYSIIIQFDKLLTVSLVEKEKNIFRSFSNDSNVN